MCGGMPGHYGMGERRRPRGWQPKPSVLFAMAEEDVVASAITTMPRSACPRARSGSSAKPGSRRGSEQDWLPWPAIPSASMRSAAIHTELTRYPRGRLGSGGQDLYA
jgi:hypothetical protein